MRFLQKLVRNGNSTGVSIPRSVLVHLGWLPGQQVIGEVLEDQSIRIRLPREQDFAPIGKPQLLFTTPESVKS